jgi:hypothetical protein
MGRRGGATTRTGSRDTRTRAERLAIARADLIEHRVRQLVAAAPPLTEQQRRRISAILDAAPVDTYAAQRKCTTAEARTHAAELEALSVRRHWWRGTTDTTDPQ